jgi:short-chain fatty acids transporter
MQDVQEKSAAPSLASAGLRLSDWFERWFPDAFALALAAIAIVFIAAAFVSGSPVRTAQAFGAGYWDLTVFTLQMSLIIVSGYAVAVSPPVYAVIRRIAAVPGNGRHAVAIVALFSMLSALISWSFTLIFSALLAREVARRLRHADYRALGAAAFLGIGSVWALGLSSSAALLMAAPASLPDSLKRISGVIPLDQTLGLWQSLLLAVILIIVSVAIAYYSAPNEKDAHGIDAMGVQLPPERARRDHAQTPGEWLEYSPMLSIAISAIGIAYVVSEVARSGPGILLDLNHYVFVFIIAGVLLHWRPRSFVNAVAAGVPSVAGVLVQYPLYAGVLGMMTASGLADRIAKAFLAISNEHTFPLLVGLYSAFLGLLVPSGGGKWLIEAPYLLTAAKALNVHLGWVVQTYNATEALPNMIHPFWMLPLIGILGLKPRDIVGYSMLQFIAHVPIVLFLVWILNYTF